MAADAEVDQRLRDWQREILNFLDDDEDQGIYQQKVRDMITNNEPRLIVNINDLRRKNPERALGLLDNSFEELIAFQQALKEFVSSADAEYGKKFEEFFVGFEGSFGAMHVTPRNLSARLLGKMVCVEGIVTKCSLIRPKVVRSVHYCPATKKSMERRYTDLTSFDAFPSTAAYPTKDEDGNALETEYGLCTYKDHQTLTIQEMPEKAPAGQLPRSVDIVLDNDLVDKVKAGERVQVVGTYRCLPGKQGGYTSGSFRTLLIANNVQHLNKELFPMFSADDVSKIKKFSRQKHDVFEFLARSLAPSIHGHEYIKKALLCMLLGGVEKVLPNGTRLRGDINCLLIGDPSVAKSQLLRYVLHTAPRSVATTGRGSSGVGLTAAVTTDQETGERQLEAGAMVLADRGVVCIDEFDKMSDIDRTAIHEVMEQGRVTIAKAGIHAKLNARCSVLAAANPVYGRYDQFKTPMENIGLQDSLLSRFDCLFIMLDKNDPESDRQISDHVLRMHRYRTGGEQDGDVLPMGSAADLFTTHQLDAEDEEEEETPVYEKYDAMLHGDKHGKKDRIVSMKFMRKYIHVAKAIKPVLTQEASDCIAEEYSKLRSQENLQPDTARTMPVTARTLETLIRLSTAHAKARLSKTVSIDDAKAAIELVQFAYFKKVMEKERKRRRANSDSEDEGEEKKRKKKRKAKTGDDVPKIRRPKKKPGEAGYDPYDFDSDEESDMDDDTQATTDVAEVDTEDSRNLDTQTSLMDIDESQLVNLSDKRLKTFKASLFKTFKEAHAQSMPLPKIIEGVNKEIVEGPFTSVEILSAIHAMQDANQVMLADNVVFLI